MHRWNLKQDLVFNCQPVCVGAFVWCMYLSVFWMWKLIQRPRQALSVFLCHPYCLGTVSLKRKGALRVHLSPPLTGGVHSAMSAFLNGCWGFQLGPLHLQNRGSYSVSPRTLCLNCSVEETPLETHSPNWVWTNVVLTFYPAPTEPHRKKQGVF